MSEWISVNDKLPETEGAYITYSNAGGRCSGVLPMEYVHRKVRGKEVRRWEWMGRISPWIVTHWMPMPEPPKEEE